MLSIIILSFFLVGIVYILFFMVFYKGSVGLEEITPYECGFDPGCSTRMMFSYRFFLISILFIIFDVEISLMLPIPFIMEMSMSLWIFMSFIFVLVVGLLYEYNYGSLDWLDIMIKS